MSAFEISQSSAILYFQRINFLRFWIFHPFIFFLFFPSTGQSCLFGWCLSPEADSSFVSHWINEREPQKATNQMIIRRKVEDEVFSTRLIWAQNGLPAGLQVCLSGPRSVLISKPNLEISLGGWWCFVHPKCKQRRVCILPASLWQPLQLHIQAYQCMSMHHWCCSDFEIFHTWNHDNSYHDIHKPPRWPDDTTYISEHSTQMTSNFVFRVHFAPTLVRLKTGSLEQEHHYLQVSSWWL